jgi:nucleotide sugar dehydrogenase
MMQEDFAVNVNQPVNELLTVMSRLTKSRRPSGFAVVVNDDKHVIGVVSDGDLRKFLILNSRMPDRIEEVVNTNFISIENQLDAENLLIQAKKIVGKLKTEARLPIKFLPVLDGREINTVLDLEEMSIFGDNSEDQIVILGLGYVGLTLAGFFLGMGHEVIGVDSDEAKVETLRQGKSYITEPGLEHIVSQSTGKKLKLGSGLRELVEFDSGSARKVFIVCVPTPVASSGEGDLRFVERAVSDIAEVLRAGDLVILRSTLPIGTSERLAQALEEESNLRAGIDFSVIFAPERTVEGNALREIRDLPQIVSGLTSNCLDKGLSFFEKFGILTVPANSLNMAELIKISSNAYRDYMFGFANYLALVAREHSLDVNAAIKAANFGYPRNNIPTPSPGVGGPCLTKDPYLLLASNLKTESPVKAARELNVKMPSYLIDFLARNIPDFSSKVVCVVGIAFKGVPETNDIRNSPGIDLLDLLQKDGVSSIAWDSVADVESLKIKNVSFSPEIFILANNHPMNREFFADKIKVSTHKAIYLVDPWRLVSEHELAELRGHRSVHYFSLSHLERDLL